jgi:hypothetical protein
MTRLVDDTGKPVKAPKRKFGNKSRAQKAMLDKAKAKQREAALNRCRAAGVVV